MEKWSGVLSVISAVRMALTAANEADRYEDTEDAKAAGEECVKLNRLSFFLK
jgi:hypothetical protein